MNEIVKAGFRTVLMSRKRKLRHTPIPKIRIKVGTRQNGTIHYEFGTYGKIESPPQYDEKGHYIKDQPFYCWASGTLYYPDYKPRWNRQMICQLWNYLRYNINNIHPADLAKSPAQPHQSNQPNED